MNLVSSFGVHNLMQVTCGTNPQIEDDLPIFFFLFIQGPLLPKDEEE